MPTVWTGPLESDGHTTSCMTTNLNQGPCHGSYPSYGNHAHPQLWVFARKSRTAYQVQMAQSGYKLKIGLGNYRPYYLYTYCWHSSWHNHPCKLQSHYHRLKKNLLNSDMQRKWHLAGGLSPAFRLLWKAGSPLG